MLRSNLLRVLIVLGIAVFAYVFGVRLGWMYVMGDLAGESYAHPAPEFWRWQPWIHPPVYGEYMRLLEFLSDTFWVGEELLAFWSGGLFAAGLVLLGGWWAGRTLGPGWDVAAAVLLGFAASNLRPFENYPPARLLILAGAASLFALHQRLPDVSRGRWIGLVVLLWTAVELHLSSWFVLGPLWFFLMVSDREFSVRARAHALGIAAWLFAFGLSTYPGLFHVLSSGPGEGRLGDGTVRWAHATLEWTNPALFLPLLLWALPAVRRGRGSWLAATAACLFYTAVTFVLMAHSLAIGGPVRASHHYFELIDPLLAMCALAALASAHAAATGRMRWGVRAATVLLIAFHLGWYLSSFLALREMAFGWTR